MPTPSVPHPADHAGVYVPPPLLYVAAFGLGLVAQQLYPLALVSQAVSSHLALGCISGGVVLSAWSISTFRRAHTSMIPVAPTTALVTDGPFRFSRNPMYLGLVLLYLGEALWLNALWPPVLLPPLLLVVQHYAIAREERYLERKFGAEYRQYQARVRRWL